MYPEVHRVSYACQCDMLVAPEQSDSEPLPRFIYFQEVFGLILSGDIFAVGFPVCQEWC